MAVQDRRAVGITEPRVGDAAAVGEAQLVVDRRIVVEAAHPVGVDALELQLALDEEPEAAPTGLLDADRRVAFVETALQQDEPALEVVAELGQLERRVEPHLLVGELDASLAFVVTEQHPQDAPGDALDEVVAVEERAAVDREEAHAGGRRARRPAPPRGAPGITGRRRRSAARSWAQSISIALATSVATTVNSASSSGPKRRALALSIATTPTSWPSTIAGTATWLSASSRPGSGISRPGASPPCSS